MVRFGLFIHQRHRIDIEYRQYVNYSSWIGASLILSDQHLQITDRRGGCGDFKFSTVDFLFNFIYNGNRVPVMSATTAFCFHKNLAVCNRKLKMADLYHELNAGRFNHEFK